MNIDSIIMNKLLWQNSTSSDDRDIDDGHWANVENFYLLGGQRVNVEPCFNDLDGQTEWSSSNSLERSADTVEFISTADIDIMIASVHDELIEMSIASSMTPPASNLPQRTREDASISLSSLCSMSVSCLIGMVNDVSDLARSGILLHRLMTHYNGSKFLQRILATSSVEYRQYLISLMLNSLLKDGIDMCQLTQDIHANYVIQQFFTMGTDSHHALIFDNFVYACVFELSRSKYGCRVLQVIPSCVKSQAYLIYMIHSFAQQSVGYLGDCLVCYNCNHVIQAMLKLQLPAKVISFITDELNRDLVGYANNVYACRVLQAHIDTYEDGLELSKLFDKDQHLELCCLKYGNYVMQNIIKRNSQFRNKLTQDVLNRRNILAVGHNRFGSNVVETCIKLASSRQLSVLVETICANRCYIAKHLALSRFGTFVISTLIKCCRREQKYYIINAVSKVVPKKCGKALKKLL